MLRPFSPSSIANKVDLTGLGLGLEAAVACRSTAEPRCAQCPLDLVIAKATLINSGITLRVADPRVLAGQVVVERGITIA